MAGHPGNTVQLMWLTRVATMNDRDAIRKLCIATAGPDDYVLLMLDDLIQRSSTIIAQDGAKVIGTITYRRQMDGSAWILSARTHPRYQRKGVAASIIRSCEYIAGKEGTHPLRLWTESDNVAGKAAFMKMGFREVGRFTRMSAPPAIGALDEDMFVLGYSERLWAMIKASESMSKSNFYLNHGAGFIKLTHGIFKTLVDQGYVYGWGANVAVMSEHMFSGMKTLEAQVLMGTPLDALKDLRMIAKANNMDVVRTFLPHDAGGIKAAKDAGFELIDWGNEAILCEKEVGKIPAKEDEKADIGEGWTENERMAHGQ